MPFYRWSEISDETITPKYSTTHGSTVNGEKLSVGVYKIPAGTGAKPHAHPNEQVIAVTKGRMRFRLGTDERVVGPGEVVHLVAGFSIHEGGWATKP